MVGRLAIVIASFFCGASFTALGTNVLTVANPKISSDFHSLQDLAWYGSAYLLTLTAFQPIFESFCKYFNTNVVHRTSILIFEAISAPNPTKHGALLILFSVGSVLCATASSSHAFIAGRTVAGLGAASILQGTLCTMSHVVELETRPLYMSIVISVFIIAACGGPPLGGVLTQRERLGDGALVLTPVTIFIRVKEAGSENRNLAVGQRLRRMDPIGCVLFVGAICCLIFALHWQPGSREALHGLRRVWSIAIDRTMLLSVGRVAVSVPFTLGMEWVNAKEVARQRKEAAEKEAEERRRTIEDDDEKAGSTTAVVVTSSSSS
ncbi:MAG: hypothetical protein Q9193_002623 [Seirophora villosa]